MDKGDDESILERSFHHYRSSINYLVIIVSLWCLRQNVVACGTDKQTRQQKRRLNF